jgi:glycosyltransferase involved in cell wall biosynthesis
MLRAELGIARNSFVVGNVARFAKQKNHRFLVDIAEHLSRMEPNVVFMLVGEGPLKPEIEALVRERGLSANFIFLGAREDVPRLLLGAMDCFLLTSLHEGLGLVVWEAQAARLTCVISDLIPEEARLEATLVRRLSLNQPAEVWANELRRLRPLADNVRDAMSSLLFDCTIQASAAALTHIYDSSLCNTHAAGGAVGSRA